MLEKKNIQTEVDASYLYDLLSKHERNETIAEVFRRMSGIERGHAAAFLKSSNIPGTEMPQPSGRAKTLGFLGRIFGYNAVLGVLLETEKSLSGSIAASRVKHGQKPAFSDSSHVAILNNILRSQSISPTELTRFEKRHRSIGGNALRAAVLGGNDGLVSNFSLVMGVAGASAGRNEVLLTGLAGLLAGALSMALGEWISVKSSQELNENQMQLEMEELETNPEGEKEELVLVYMAKGISEAEARTLAADVMSDKTRAHEILVREELGINPHELKGSAMEASLSSFFLFAAGAIIPVIPFFFTGGMTGVLASAACSCAGLFLIGAAITLFTGKTVLRSGFRQMIFGLIAASITFAIGKLIGVSMS